MTLREISLEHLATLCEKGIPGAKEIWTSYSIHVGCSLAKGRAPYLVIYWDGYRSFSLHEPEEMLVARAKEEAKAREEWRAGVLARKELEAWKKEEKEKERLRKKGSRCRIRVRGA